MSALDGTGVQHYELPPRGRERLWLQPANFNYFFKYLRAAQLAEPPPRGRARLRDYPANFVYFFRDAQARLTGFSLESVTSGNPFTRLTGFAIETVIQRAIAGDQLSGNAPQAPLRSSDYTFANIPTQSLLVSGNIPPDGDKPLFRTALPPRGPAYLRDYTWVNTLYPNLVGQDQFPAGLDVHASDNLTPKAQARSVDYTFTFSTFQGLLGADQFNVGVQFFELPPKAPARLSDYSLSSAFDIVYITAPPPVYPRMDFGVISTGPSVLPTPAPRRSPDYSFSAYRFAGIVDVMGPGIPAYEQIPRGPLRLSDYGFAYAFPVQFPPAGPDPTSMPFKRSQDLPPRKLYLIRGLRDERIPFVLLVFPFITTNETFQAVLFI